MVGSARDKRTVVTDQGRPQGVGRDHELEDDLEDALRPEDGRHLLRGTHRHQVDAAVGVNLTALGKAMPEVPSVAAFLTLMSTPACTMTVS